jgi:ribose transport system substrate-binding protein
MFRLPEGGFATQKEEERMTHVLGGHRRGWLALTAALALALALAACGSSSSSSSSSSSGGSASSSSSSGASASVPSVPYSGPEKSLPHTLAVPTVKAGFHYKVGYMSPYAAIPSLAAAINGARVETQKLGGTFILEDGQLNPNLQATQINQLISQGVNAMMVYPVNPAALLPGFAAAKKAGIPIIMEDTPPVAGSPLIKGSYTDILQGRDAGEYAIAQGAAKAQPGATFVNLGLAVPVPLLQYGVKRDTYWATKFGMKYLGEVDTTTDTPGGAATAMNSILAKYPNVQVVFAYNDQAADAAAAVARSNGKLNIKVIGDNGDPVAIKEIQAGRVWGTFNSDFTSIGRLQAIATYDLLTKQHLPLPKQVSVGGLLVTKANSANVNPEGDNGVLPPVK